jgi:hypothetical protein
MAASLLAPGLIAAPALAEEAAVAYTNATIETVGKAGRLENATVVLRGGKVEAVGTDVKIPDDARVLDARGKTLMPGVLDPFREVTISTATADTGARTIVIGGRTITLAGRPGGASAAFTRIADNFYPYESGYRVLLRSGLTGLNLVTAGYGQAAVVRVTPAQPDGMLANPDGFLFTAVSNETSSLDVVRTALETAERARKGQAVNLPTAPPPTAEPPPANNPPPRPGRRGQQVRQPAFRGGFTPSLTPETLKLWRAVLEGKAPLFANANNAAAIVHLYKALEPYKDVKLILIAPGQALYETLDLLPARPVRLIVRPGLSLKPNTRDRIDVAHLLHDAGLEFAFTQPAGQSDLAAAQDAPLFPVAYLVRCGLPRKVALEALTARPAA